MSAFIVIVQQPGITQRAFGPYRSFKRASVDAKAWDGYVLPIEPREEGEPSRLANEVKP